MLILGISGLRHHSTASLVRDGEVLAACEEGKLTGRADPSGLPRKAMQYCLEKAGAAPSEVQAVAMDTHPWRLWGSEMGFRAAKFLQSPLASTYYGIESFNHIREQLNNVRLLREMYPQAEIAYCDHHRSHAAAAYFASGFERSLVLTLDSGGAWGSGFLGIGEGTEIRPLASATFPDSPGFLYSQITGMLGWRINADEHRTQWLSTIGKPDRRQVFDRIFEPMRGGELRIQQGCFNSGVAEVVCLSRPFLKELGLADGNWRKAATMPEEWRSGIAASLQAALEDAVVSMVSSWREKTGVSALCFGGGVAFNALLVEALAGRAGFAQGFVSPVAGNSGCALGAAWLYGLSKGIAPRGTPFSPYLGPSFSPQYIKDFLDNCRLTYRNLTQPQMIQAVTDKLAAGSFVGWFQGAAEFGPRALGNRSILAAPTDEWVKENLNAFTKRRESFRPLAASVVEEQASEFFEFPWSSPPSFLGTVAKVKDPGAIPGLAFSGNRARVHVVSRTANRQFHDLLMRCGQVIGRPLLINTSFNAPGEPLVVTPQEALRVFYSTGIDCMALGDFLIGK
jgi:carbamoyltransferase